MDYHNFIIRNPQILAGKPIIKGTRISVELILKKMSEGATILDLLKSYPHINEEQIYAVLAYSSAVIGNENEYCYPKNQN